ncbi:MAG: AbrB/MazE/SpoVT family DNA-binding domain-containing protein [bacterium]
MNGMKAELSIDKAGRIILPQAVRRQFHLVAGDRLDLKILPDGIFLKTHERQAHLVENNGLLVHEGEPTGDLIRAVELSRSGRDAEVLGWRQ